MFMGHIEVPTKEARQINLDGLFFMYDEEEVGLMFFNDFMKKF